MIFSIVVFTASSCSRAARPEKTVRTARDLLARGQDAKACHGVQALSPAGIAIWPQPVAWEWLRQSALCAVRSGGDLPARVRGLPSPYGSYAAGMLDFYRRDFAAAKRRLQAAVARSSGREPAYRLALLYLLDERFEKALPLLESALQDPSLRPAPVRLALARCLLGLGRLSEVVDALRPVLPAATRSELVLARRLVETALAWNRRVPPELLPRLDKVRMMLQVEEPAAALDELEKIMQQYRDIALLQYLRGVIHLRLGNRADAVSSLLAALQMEPGDPEAHMLLGHIFFHAQRDDQAVSHLEAAVNGNPFLAAAWARLRDVHARNEAYTKAVLAHETFMRLSENPDAVEHLSTLAQLQEKAGRLEDAAAIHRRIVQRQGDEEAFASLIALARIHLALSSARLDQALAHRQKAVHYLQRAEKIRATDAELAQLKEKLGFKGKKTFFEKNMRTSGGKKVEDVNLME